MYIKINISTSSIILLSTFYTGASVAALSEKQGYTGELSIITGYSEQASNFNTDGEKVTAGNLNQKPRSENGFLIAPLGSVRYTFGTELDKQVFIGTSREDIAVGDVAFEIGYKQALSSGSVMSFSYLPSVISAETWKDPYLLGSEKQSTDVSGNAFRFQLSAIASSHFSLDIAYATTDIDDEQSGTGLTLAERSLLNRNGSSVYLKSNYKYIFDQTTLLIPSLTYISHSADGEAMSFNSYSGDLTYVKMLGDNKIAITAAYRYSYYDAVNPLFNKTRSDNAYKLFAAYELGLGGNLDDWSFISMFGYNQSISNIEFYDENGLIVILGLKYKF